MTLLNYIEPNYNYVAVFTNLDSDERDLIRKKISLKPNGFTCCWKMTKEVKNIDKVILYIRENGINKIYTADYDDREKIREKRYKILFKNLEFIENTSSNWMEFAHSQNPVRYIVK